MARPLQFSLATVLWFGPACALAAATWAGYRSIPHRNAHPLATALLSLGLIVALNGALLTGRTIRARPRRERATTAALVGLIVGLAVHYWGVSLLGSTGSLVAMSMKEDDLGRLGTPGAALRIFCGIVSAIAFARLGANDPPDSETGDQSARIE